MNSIYFYGICFVVGLLAGAWGYFSAEMHTRDFLQQREADRTAAREWIRKLEWARVKRKQDEFRRKYDQGQLEKSLTMTPVSGFEEAISAHQNALIGMRYYRKTQQ